MIPNQDTVIDGKKITPVEFEIIRLLVQDKPRKQIAAERGVSEDTLDGQMRYSYEKVKVKSAVGLTGWALENGFTRIGVYTPKNKPVRPSKTKAVPVKKKKK